MTDYPDLWCVAAHIALFAVSVWQSRSVLWLLAALSCWLAAGFAASLLLPHYLSLLNLPLLYIPHLYTAPACLLFLLTRRQAAAAKSGQGALPVLFAASCTTLAVAHGLVLLFSWLVYPDGLAPRLLPVFASLYLLQPEYWFAMQLLLMAVFALHGRIDGRSAAVFNIRSMQAGLLLVLAVQAVYAASVLFPGLFF